MNQPHKIVDTRYHPSEDYHNFCHRGSDQAWRDKFHIGDIYVNAAICGVCNYFIRSKNRHDYVLCSCGATAVDGGSWYIKRSFKTPNYVDVIEMFNDVEDKDNG